MKQVFIQVDTSPTSGVEFIRQIQAKTRELGVGTIATIIGRYYAMDRDKRWERVSEAYRAIVAGAGPERDDPVAAVAGWYAEGKTDEFLPSTIIRNPGVDPADQTVRDGDGILFHFRPTARGS
jgi:2,3-bisphosphoglycerate-independent phosphoglycerate mutase